MIVQRLRQGGTPRFITQRGHARLAGILARAWDVTLTDACLDAIDRHDDPWIEEDLAPRPDGQGWYHDFVSIDLERRLALYTAGLDALGATYAALLASRHYVRLLGSRVPQRFAELEAARARRLSGCLGVGEQALEHDLAWLRFFDALSLFVCMTPPFVDASAAPAWLAPASWATDPRGRDCAPIWRGDGLLALGAGLERPVDVVLTHRDASLAPGQWRLTVCRGRRTSVR